MRFNISFITGEGEDDFAGGGGEEAAADVVAEDDFADDDGSSSSCKSSSSKSGSSSSSSSSASSSSAGSPVATVPLVPVEHGHDEPRAKRRRSEDASELWGNPHLKLFRITSNVNSWQCTCHNPYHEDEGIKCTKTRSSLIDGDEVAIRMLKTWAREGLEVFVEKDNGDCWEEVLHAHEAGYLLSTEELEHKVLEIIGWPGMEDV